MSAVIDGLTIGEASRRAGVSPQWLRRLADRGELAVTQTPYGRLIDPVDLERFAAEREARQAARESGRRTSSRS